GTAIPSTSYDPAVRVGYGNRQYDWEYSLAVQHEIMPRVGVEAGYFRRNYGNFVVTDNLAVSATDFSPFRIAVPVDTRLTSGGGYVVGGFYNLNPDRVGQVNNYVTRAEDFGGQLERWNGVDVSVNARFRGGALLRGGFSSGRTVSDTCGI